MKETNRLRNVVVALIGITVVFYAVALLLGALGMDIHLALGLFLFVIP